MDKKLLFLVLAVASLLYSQEGYPDWENYTYSEEIIDIDGRGDHLWVATSGGILKVNVKTNETNLMTHANSGLLYHQIVSILLDGSGRKWFMREYRTEVLEDTIFESSILFYEKDDNWFEFDYTTPSLPLDKSYQMTEDSSGNIWITSFDDKLVKYDNNSWEIFSHKNGKLPDLDNIYNLAADKEGNLWLALYDLIKFDGINFETYKIPDKSGFLRDLSVDNNGKIFFIQSPKKLSIFDKGEWMIYDTSNSNIPDVRFLEEINFDSENNAWMRSNTRLVKFDGSKFSVYDPSNSGLDIERIRTLYVDKYNNKWVGTPQGLLKYDGNKWEIIHSSRHSILPSKNGVEVAVDSTNTIWFGLENHLLSYTNSKWKDHKIIDTTFDQKLFIMNISFDVNNNKWLGTYRGAIEYDGKTITIYDTTNSGISDNSVTDIKFDNFGNTWFATTEGVSVFDGKNWTVYDTLNSGLVSNWIWELDIDKNGIAWICTDNGLVRYDGNSWQVYNADNSPLKHNSTYSILIDNKNNKWIGTWHGLYRFNGEEWKYYSGGNSHLPTDYTVLDIKIDQNNNIWIATGDGIAKLDGEEWIVYNKENSGLQTPRAGSISFDQDGNLWAGTREGVALFKNAVSSIFEQQSPVISHINYPNPFKQHTNISFELEQAGFVSISVFDSFGEEVASLVNTHKTAGKHITEFDAEGISPGVYYYTISANGKTDSGKLVVVR